MASALGDHEYEPINPPPLEGNVLKTNGLEKDNEDRHFLRIPRDEELIVSPEDMEVEAIATAQDLDDELDERYLATTPMTNTTSRTDCDVNTSMLDSSGLEDLPLKRDSRSKKAIQSKTEQMRAQAQGIQQRLRSQAGKLKNKLRSIPRPSFQRKNDKSKQETEDKPRFRLPEKAKFNLPDRSKFKMPQKPKLNLPSFGRQLKDRQQTLPGGKKNIFDIDFKTYPRMFSKKSKDRGDYATSSPKLPRSATPPPPPIQPSRKKGPVGQRWVNRFDDIKFADDKASEISRRSDRSESLSGFHERDFAISDDLDHAQLPPARTFSTKSSLSHLSDREIQSSRSSEDRHRKGVIEEIDSDQFFLRQKGISEEDIDMGKYLSKEIREAFKSPVVNALRQMDYDYDREIEKENMMPLKHEEVDEPLPPTRTRSLKRTPKPEMSNSTMREQSTIQSQAEEDTNKNRYENVEEDRELGYYKTPPPPVEYQHYKVPKPVRPNPIKRKSSNTEDSMSKKKQNGWVEVEIETSLEEVQRPERRRSKKSFGGPQLSTDVEELKTEEPDYIIPDEVAPEPPIRTRSLSRGARSTHSLAQPPEEEASPIPPKRTSSKSLHKIGLTNDSKPLHYNYDSKSLHGWTAQNSTESDMQAAKRTKSLSRGAKSFHSLTAELANGNQLRSTQTLPSDRTRSLSRQSKSYHSIAAEEAAQMPQAPERTRSLSRCSKKKENIIETTAVIENFHHYEAAPDDDYAVVDKGCNKPKPPRPPPPRRKKGSQSPTFNTFPRRSPIRPIRNYATLGPSRPPRRTRIGPAKSLEHLNRSERSDSYAQIGGNTLQINHNDDIHGSNKDLQAEDVVEKMKGRPLPAPPRPPRLKSKSDEQAQSMEEVEEVCVSTQTDPLPDDVCLEDDMIQEFSHEQLRVQEAFLQEMRAEEERIQKEIEDKRSRKIDVTVEQAENDAKMEIIRQMDDIIQEEKRLLSTDGLQRQEEEDSFHEAEDDNKSKMSQLQAVDLDMGYASLERRPGRIEDDPQPSTSFQEPQAPPRAYQTAVAPAPLVTSQAAREPIYIPLVPEILNAERLHIAALEVDRLTVNDLQANNAQIHNMRSQLYEAREIRGTTLQVEDIGSRSGTGLSLGNIEIPPDLVQQILLRIPWEQLRPPPLALDQEQTPDARRTQITEEEMAVAQPATQHVVKRRHRPAKTFNRSRYSSDEETEVRHVARRHNRTIIAEPTVIDLSRQLSKACTTAAMSRMRQFANLVRPPAEIEDRNRYVQIIFCVVVIAIAGYFLLGFNRNDVHHHHWDFQFPPQPPEQ